MPAAPTRSEIETSWKAAINLFHQTYKYGSKNATNFLALLDTLQQSMEGEFMSEAVSVAEALRSSLAGLVTRSTAQALFRPFLQMYMRHVIGRTDLSSDEEMLQELYRYFIDNNLRVQGRDITYGTPTAASGIHGTTQVLRLTRDRYNFPIESCYVDKKRLRCILDSNTGAGIGGESWNIKGQTRPKDDLYRSGSGEQGILTGQTIDSSLLSNPGFRTLGGSAGLPDDIPDWVSSVQPVSSTVFEYDSTNYFRRTISDGSSGTVYSLKLKASVTLSQKLTVKGTQLDTNTPYLTAVVWNRALGAGSGTLTIRQGNVQQSIAVAAQTGWVVSCVPTAPTWACWYRVFAKDDVDISLQWARSGGDIRIAEVLFLPGTYFDGSYYWVLPSSVATYVPPRIDDEFNWADISPDSIIQACLAFAWPGFYLPSSIGSSISLSDP